MRCGMPRGDLVELPGWRRRDAHRHGDSGNVPRLAAVPGAVGRDMHVHAANDVPDLCRLRRLWAADRPRMPPDDAVPAAADQQAAEHPHYGWALADPGDAEPAGHVPLPVDRGPL